MKHYVPFQKDLNDLEERLMWAKNHDNEVRIIYQISLEIL